MRPSGERAPLARPRRFALLAYPRAVVADWADSASISNDPIGGHALYTQLLERWHDPYVVPILAGYVPFQAGGVEPLGGGFARILKQGDDPLLVHVVNAAGLTTDAPGLPSFELGKGRTKLVVFSPVAGTAELALTLRPYPGRPGTRLVVFQSAEDYNHRAVRLASEGDPVAAVPLAGERALGIPLDLPVGLSTIVLRVDAGGGVFDARELVTVVGLRLGKPHPSRWTN